MRIALSAALALALAAPAGAAWEPTDPIGPPGVTFRSPLLAFSPSGSALVTWATTTPGPQTHVAPWHAGGAPAERRTMADELVVEPLFLGGGRALFVRARSPDGLGSGPVVLSTSIGTFDGALGKPRRLARFMPSGAYAVAQSASGEVALVWSEVVGNHYRLRLALMRRREFARPITLGSLGPGEHPGITSVGVAYGRRDELVIAAQAARKRRRVEALIGRPGHFRRQVLGGHDGITELEAASARGRVIVAWRTQDGGEEANRPAKVRVAVREPRRRRFNLSLVDPGEVVARPPGNLALAMAPNGSALLAWTRIVRVDGVPTPLVMAATAARHGSFGGSPALVAPGGAVGDAAMSADGSRLVTWTRSETPDFEQPGPVFAAVRAKSGGFLDPEQLSQVDASGLPAAGFNGSAFVLAWAERTGAPDQTSVVRAAVHAG